MANPANVANVSGGLGWFWADSLATLATLATLAISHGVANVFLAVARTVLRSRLNAMPNLPRLADWADVAALFQLLQQQLDAFGL